MSRSMVKLIHVDGFYDKHSANQLALTVSNLKYVPTPYGEEVPDFNMIPSGIEPIISKVVGERIKIDGLRSGVFRKPANGLIHFEDFDSPEEWCLIIALEPNTLNLYNHISEPDKGDFSKINSFSALENYKFNYRNLFEWNVHTNVVLQPNDAVFIRPWMFHSLYDNIVQYYRLIADKKFRVLIMGLDDKSRNKVSADLQTIIPKSKLLVSNAIRISEKDVDYTFDGQIRHAYRMLDNARESKEDIVLIDMTCPLPEMREILNPDVIIWIDTSDINTSENCQKNSFVPPKLYDLKFNTTEGIHKDILAKIESKDFKFGE